MNRSAARPANPPRLTPVEVEIVLQIVAGKRARQIAAALQLTEDQAQSHILAILDKTACDTPTQLAAAWALYGQEEPPSSPAELHAQNDLLKVENSALRQRVRELQTALDYLADHPRIRQSQSHSLT